MALARPFAVPRDWTGKTAVVIGGGPSVSARQIRAIAQARLDLSSKIRVIAVNDAVYLAWWADWLHAHDRKWWSWHIQKIHKFAGVKTTLSEDVPAPWVTGFLKNTGRLGFDPDPGNCRHGNNSGYQAIHIAMHAGVEKIILVGFDMQKAPGGESHWFGDHPIIEPAMHQITMAPSFESLVDPLAVLGISVINASPGSALATFPMAELESLL